MLIKNSLLLETRIVSVVYVKGHFVIDHLGSCMISVVSAASSATTSPAVIFHVDHVLEVVSVLIWRKVVVHLLCELEALNTKSSTVSFIHAVFFRQEIGIGVIYFVIHFLINLNNMVEP